MRYLPLMVVLAVALPVLAEGPAGSSVGVTVGSAPAVRYTSVADVDLQVLDPQDHELGNRLVEIGPGNTISAGPTAKFPFAAIPLDRSVCVNGVCPDGCAALDFACRAGAPRSGRSVPRASLRPAPRARPPR